LLFRQDEIMQQQIWSRRRKGWLEIVTRVLLFAIFLYDDETMREMFKLLNVDDNTDNMLLNCYFVFDCLCSYTEQMEPFFREVQPQEYWLYKYPSTPSIVSSASLYVNSSN
jgi:hypothetical protein